ASARLLDWTQLDPAARRAQVDTAVAIAAGKLERTIGKTWEPATPLPAAVAIWISDIRHQGRGGTKEKPVMEFIREALNSGDPEARLKQAPGTADSRIGAVTRGLADLKQAGFLDATVYVGGRFVRKA
ncbi:hypothetical protein, partial [Rhodoplanes sp. SY1]|uniref:hypothetical protein n=1 Tax=Rhodoplanes sp. SY1 TaxID=3166646 RepID=UPI0038B4DADA